MLCHGFPELAFSWRHQLQPLADAGYHVLAPDQRGYGRTDKPAAVESYDLVQLTGDLVGLLDHYGYEDAVFVGHDWGAIVVWGMALLHPKRVAGVINLSVPFLDRGAVEWVEFWEKMLGDDFYIVHFNRKPGVADAAFARNPKNLLRHLYRTDQWNSPARRDTTRHGDDQPGRRRWTCAGTPDDVGGRTRRVRKRLRKKAGSRGRSTGTGISRATGTRWRRLPNMSPARR